MSGAQVRSVRGWALALAVGVMACGAGKETRRPDEELAERLEAGLRALEKKRYGRAQEQFEHVALYGSHTDLADDAAFYLGETHFRNKAFLEAIDQFEKLVRQMEYSPFVERARYRICESYVAKSPKLHHDQNHTLSAIERLQEFIEDYPDSEHRQEAGRQIRSLRTKLAEKLYATAELYLKLEEWTSALVYLDDLLDTYYDTDVADQARVLKVQTLVRAGRMGEAEAFWKENAERFADRKLEAEAKKLLRKTTGEGGRKKKGS